MSKKPHNARTQLEHLGRSSTAHFGSVNTPVYRVSTALFPDLKTFRSAQQPMTYGRRVTPSSQALTQTIAQIEGGDQSQHHCVLTPSGLAAVTCAILSCVEAGGHILVADNVYGPTRVFCDRILPRMKVAVDYYDPIDLSALAQKIKPETSAVFAESPGSLTFEVQDIPAIAEITHKNNASLIMDNTWATPLFFKPFAHGVDISVQAATKYLCGHADLLLGTITANEKTWRDLRRMHGQLGLCASGDDIYLTLRGLRTLDVRLERHMQTGINIAKFLQTRDEIAEVIHPALPSHPQHDIWQRDFTGASGLFAARLKPRSEKSLAAMFDHFELFGLGYSWGGFESLIIPAEPIRTASSTKNAPEGHLIRIHAGLEDEEDLIEDLKAGLERL